MLEQINLDAIAMPLSENSPSGEDLRYTKVYDDIKEARREEDDIPQGDWKRETKSADWDKVVRLANNALTTQTKDFQIAAWLSEALSMSDGFEGVESGLRVLTVILSNFWESAYPLVEEDDYDFRAAPFEFLNGRLTAAIRMIALTDPRTSQGYSFLKWKESRDVGYENDTRTDRRSELIAEGKLSPEEFDSAVAKSSALFYKSLADSIAACIEAFGEMDALLDETFGTNAPRVSEIGQILEECNRVVVKICREQKGLRSASEPEPGEMSATSSTSAEGSENRLIEQATQFRSPLSSGLPATEAGEGAQENALWNEAVRIMQGGALKDALNLLLTAAGSQQSERGRNRCRFLVAKLCLKAGRPDLAKPIVEQLYALINELHLDNWESPYWISEILESLYQCLTSAEYADQDPARAQELFTRICTLDVTKVLGTRM